jgi:glucose-fructose oxidoreductase
MKKIRYAVVGQGYFAQVAVLPAFKHASASSELAALVSDDPRKLRKLGKKYRVGHTLGYDQLDDFLATGAVDAVYLAVPNSLHRDFTLRAARAGVHVLCEKPMAMSEAECQEMIDACEQAGVKLMIAYRLHFERANLEAVDLVTKRRLGEPRAFESSFSFPAEKGNIRLRAGEGGPLWDIGAYCVNAARYLFRDEPIEVVGITATGRDPRFEDSHETASAVLRFPDERVATFTVSYGVVDTSWYEVLGTKGRLRVEPAYEFAGPTAYSLTIGGKTRKKKFPARDQIAAELVYFSDCIRDDRAPEPSGHEGLADVRVLRAILRSADTGRAVVLGAFEKRGRPSLAQEDRYPPVEEPDLVHAEPPH